MTDFIIFGVSGTLIFCLLYGRFRYARSMTGLTNGGAVTPNYWGSYSANVAADSHKIQLPSTRGLCPICGSKALSGPPCGH